MLWALPLQAVLKETVNQEMDTEIAPLKEQFHTALALSPGTWSIASGRANRNL